MTFGQVWPTVRRGDRVGYKVGNNTRERNNLEALDIGAVNTARN